MCDNTRSLFEKSRESMERNPLARKFVERMMIACPYHSLSEREIYVQAIWNTLDTYAQYIRDRNEHVTSK